ncbi:ABC transporter substrate-binding protein [Ornithinimicrobium faecis]|uniref:ABC transporter substrate-binding protein n=1 Tax=Ornithinimicrobium faecis TaxID=2934158 RepID=UPI002118B2FE|nr:ABC transporter substrate-binding protein [Ornithinimicrobium sp. HY1745]
MARPKFFGTRIAVLAAGLSLTLAACGGDASSDDSSEADNQQADGSGASAGSEGGGEAASLLPDDIKEQGYITVAGDASYPPIGFMDEDGVTIIGLDHELAELLSAELGVELQVENASFDSIIPGLQGGKYDAGMSWMNDTEERRQVVDFIDYSEDGSSMFVPAESEARPESLEDLCGLRVAVQKGTVQQTDADTASQDCEAAGNDPVEVQVFPDQSAANGALASGRADVSIADTPVASWQVTESDGKFELTGEPYGAVYHGIAVIKDSELAEPLAVAMQAIMDDGSYLKVLETWGMEDAAIDQVLINGEPLE